MTSVGAWISPWPNRADLLVYVGAELETGYLPKLVQGARNANIQEGAVGHLNSSSLVTLLDKPGGPVDRSQGDLHPSGNPHFWLNPHNGLAVARLESFSKLATTPSIVR